MRMTVRRTLLLLFATFLSATSFAQTVLPEGYSRADTVVVISVPQVNPALDGVDILVAMPPCVAVRQSSAIRSALDRQVESNRSRMFNGFRVRVFHDNSQSARERSSQIETAFRRAYPLLAVERSYSNQFFNVTVGAFRTRSEAEKLLRILASQFPQASIVKEKFKYPMLDSYGVYPEGGALDLTL